MKLTFRALLLIPFFMAYQAHAEDSLSKELRSISDLKARKEKDRANISKPRVVVKAGGAKKSASEDKKNQDSKQEVKKKSPDVAVEKPKIRVINQSVMFSKEEVTRLNTVYNAYIQTLKNRGRNQKGRNAKTKDVLQDIVNKLKPTKEQKAKAPTKVYIKAPAYIYLNSILYRDPNNSTIWVNGNQLDSGESSDGLTVLRVTQDRVDFLWRIFDKQLPIDEWRRKSIERARDTEGRVAVNSNKRFLKFSLGVNQTLNVKEMMIVEGKSVVRLEGADNDTLYDPRFPNTRFTPEGRKAYEAQIAEEAKEAQQAKDAEEKRLEVEANKKKAVAAKRRAQRAKQARENKKKAEAAKKGDNAKKANKQ